MSSIQGCKIASKCYNQPISEEVIVPGTEATQRIKDLEGRLQELMAEKNAVLMDPALRSSGTLLANQYAFEIAALQHQLLPEDYRKIGSASGREDAQIKFGSHSKDVLVPGYSYDWANKLVKDTGLMVWRVSTERDYVKPA